MARGDILCAIFFCVWFSYASFEDVQQLLDFLYGENHFVVLDDTWLIMQLHANLALEKEMFLDLLKAPYKIRLKN